MAPPGNAERRPQPDQLETTSEMLQGGGETTPSVRHESTARRQAHRRLHAVVDGAVADVVLDAGSVVGLSHLSSREWSIYLAGHESGASWGVERGRRLADDEAQWPFEIAQQHMHRLAEIEPHHVRWQRAVGARRSSREDDLLLLADLISSDGWRAVPA